MAVSLRADDRLFRRGDKSVTGGQGQRADFPSAIHGLQSCDMTADFDARKRLRKPAAEKGRAGRVAMAWLDV